MAGTICDIPLSPLGVSGDDLYCAPFEDNLPLIKAIYHSSGMSKSDWAWKGNGLEDADNPLLPFARTLAAFYLLNYSAGAPLTEEVSHLPIFWGPIFVWQQINDVRPGCGDTVASAFDGTWIQVNPEFFQRSVVERAGTLVHEGRHQPGKHVNRDRAPHNAVAKPSSALYSSDNPNAMVCDSHWEYWGAWALNASYLGSFWERAVGTTSAMRERARQRANFIMDNAFTTHPGYTIAPTLPSPFSVVSLAPNTLDVFVRGTVGGVFEKVWTGDYPWLPEPGGPDDWWHVGGEILGTPVAVPWGPNRLDLFVRSTDSAIYHKEWSDGAWHPGDGPADWEPVGGAAIGPPTVVTMVRNDGPDQLHVFVTGTSGAVYQKILEHGPKWIPSDGLEDWIEIGGGIIGTPAATSWGPDRLDIFVMGAENGVFHKAWDTDRWYPGHETDAWEWLSGQPVAPPAVVSWGPGRLDIFITGTNNRVYHKWWDGSHWQPNPTNPVIWEPLGRPNNVGVVNTPTVVSWGPGRLDVFIVAADSKVYHKALKGNKWYPAGENNWEPLGGDFVGPLAATAWGPNRLDVFASGTNARLYHKWWDGSDWGPNPYDQKEWELIGGKLG